MRDVTNLYFSLPFQNWWWCYHQAFSYSSSGLPISMICLLPFSQLDLYITTKVLSSLYIETSSSSFLSFIVIASSQDNQLDDLWSFLRSDWKGRKRSPSLIRSHSSKFFFLRSSFKLRTSVAQWEKDSSTRSWLEKREMDVWRRKT